MIVPNQVQIGQRALGNTGLIVSEIALGTVGLGMNYGIAVPGSYGKPSFADSERLLKVAADDGITLFDTAPVYGDSESILGRVLGNQRNCLFATKVSIPFARDGSFLTGFQLNQAIHGSLVNSLKTLRRDVLDVVQIHNATVETFESEDWCQVLMSTRRDGLVRVWGASVYTEQEALAAIRSGMCQIIQVPFNLLDQQMATRVFPLAAEAGVGVLVRSIFLKGVLTEKAQSLPWALGSLKKAVGRIQADLQCSWRELSQWALRFGLSTPGVSSVLVGLRENRELQVAREAAGMGRLRDQEFLRAQTWALQNEPYLNPSFWPVE